MTISKLFKKKSDDIDIEAILYSKEYYNPAYQNPRLRLDGESDWEYRDRLRSYQWL